MPISTNEPHVAVIGSGPAGVSCAKALIRRGVRVTMLDPGKRLDDRRRALVQKLGALEHQEWSREDRVAITDNYTIGQGAIPKKLVFGSDFIYETDLARAPVSGEEVLAVPTFAQGGYTIAWGAAVMPTSDRDMAGWPITRSDLEPSYRTVLAEFPLSAQHDALEKPFPLFREPDGALRLSGQSRRFAGDFTRVSVGDGGKAGETLLVGQSRLAVRSRDDSAGRACRYCGICLSGCVYGAIHSLDRDVEELSRRGVLDYRRNIVVHSLKENAKGVAVIWSDIEGRQHGSDTFSRVFLAAGALNSTRIMLTSLKRLDEPVRFVDSQKFVLPLFRLVREPLEWPATNSLADLFIEALFPDITPHWVHMQISSPNDFVLARLGLLRQHGMRWRLMAPLVERLMIAWCGLHSNESHGFTAMLRRGSGTDPELVLKAQPNPRTRKVIRQIGRRMALRGLPSKTLFLPLPTISGIGGGNHYGGSFPMTGNAAAFNQTDLFGRPAGARRIHMVDSAVLPSLPATTVALLIMANADRIGRTAPLEQD